MGWWVRGFEFALTGARPAIVPEHATTRLRLAGRHAEYLPTRGASGKKKEAMGPLKFMAIIGSLAEDTGPPRADWEVRQAGGG